jgi:hypothetical protein
MTGCFAGSASSDISLDHEFHVTMPGNNNGIIETQEQCYIPNVSSTFTKLQSDDPNLSWKISDIKDAVDLESAQVEISSLTVTLEDGNDQIVFSGASSSVAENHFDLTNQLIDHAALQRILNSNMMQICVEVTGAAMTTTSISINNSISFNLELDDTKNLLQHQ